MSHFTIRNMTPDELTIAVDWAAKEGWNPGLNDAELFYQADPNGFFVGEVNGEIVAVGSAVNYDPNFAFCGLYIVAPEHRGKGYGLALTQHRLTYCGQRNIGIDGVLENVEIYQQVGYRPFYQNKRFQKRADAQNTHFDAVHVVKNDHIKEIITYDRQCFPAPRESFLTAWLTQPHGKAVCFIEDNKIKGYAVRRQCLEGYKVGPLFADSQQIAEQLFNTLQQDIAGSTIILDVPENNPNAITLVTQANMKVVFATARMYQKGLPNIDQSKIFGITTFELG